MEFKIRLLFAVPLDLRYSTTRARSRRVNEIHGHMSIIPAEMEHDLFNPKSDSGNSWQGCSF